MSEWYLVASVGSGTPAKMPDRSCRTSDVLPCLGSGARITFAPNATAAHCRPRQTPSVGIPRVGACRTRSGERPAASGRPGPGEMTSRSGLASSAASSARSSARMTVTVAPSAPNACARLYVNES